MLRPRHSQGRSPFDGFTLIELVVVMSVAGVLMAVGIFGFTNWRFTAQQQGSAGELVSTLRGTSERAVSEGRTYCVDVSARTSFTVWKYSCGGAGSSKVSGPFTVQDQAVKFDVTLTNPSPAPACPSGDSCLYFYPRGTAVPATVTVSSSRRSRVYTVHVEGLTARVWM